MSQKFAPFADQEEKQATELVNSWHTEDPHHKDLDLLIDKLADLLRSKKSQKDEHNRL